MNINFNLPFDKQLSNEEKQDVFNGKTSYFEFYVKSYNKKLTYLDSLNFLIAEALSLMNLSLNQIKQYDRKAKNNLAVNILSVIESKVLLAFENSDLNYSDNIKIFEDIDNDINFTLIKEFLHKI
jgi:hypothetical protein